MNSELEKGYKTFIFLAFIAEILMYIVGACALFSIVYSWANSSFALLTFERFTGLAIYVFLFCIAFFPVTLLIRYARLKVEIRLAGLSQAERFEARMAEMPMSPPML